MVPTSDSALKTEAKMLRAFVAGSSGLSYKYSAWKSPGISKYGFLSTIDIWTGTRPPA